VGVGGGVPVPLGVGVLVSVPDGVSGGVALPERDALGLALEVAPTLSEPVGETVTVELPETVVVGDHEPVPVPEGVGVAVEEGEGVGGGVPELDCEILPVLEGEAPLVSDAVGEADTVELAERVLLGVGAAVPVPEGVGVPEVVPVGVAGGVAVLEKDMLGVLVADAPADKEAVDEAENALLPLSVEVGEAETVPLTGVEEVTAVERGRALILKLLLSAGEGVLETAAAAVGLVVPDNVAARACGVPEVLLERELLPLLEAEMP